MGKKLFDEYDNQSGIFCDMFKYSANRKGGGDRFMRARSKAAKKKKIADRCIFCGLGLDKQEIDCSKTAKNTK